MLRCLCPQDGADSCIQSVLGACSYSLAQADLDESSMDKAKPPLPGFLLAVSIRRP